MNQQEFTSELESIVRDTREKVVALVQRARQDDDKTCSDDSRPLPFAYDFRFNSESTVDSLALLAAWIYDRVSGYTPRKTRGNLTSKIRKALGYTIS